MPMKHFHMSMSPYKCVYISIFVYKNIYICICWLIYDTVPESAVLGKEMPYKQTHIHPDTERERERRVVLTVSIYQTPHTLHTYISISHILPHISYYHIYLF